MAYKNTLHRANWSRLQWYHVSHFWLRECCVTTSKSQGLAKTKAICCSSSTSGAGWLQLCGSKAVLQGAGEQWGCAVCWFLESGWSNGLYLIYVVLVREERNARIVVEMHTASWRFCPNCHPIVSDMTFDPWITWLSSKSVEQGCAFPIRKKAGHMVKCMNKSFVQRKEWRIVTIIQFNIYAKQLKQLYVVGNKMGIWEKDHIGASHMIKEKDRIYNQTESWTRQTHIWTSRTTGNRVLTQLQLCISLIPAGVGFIVFPPPKKIGFHHETENMAALWFPSLISAALPTGEQFPPFTSAGYKIPGEEYCLNQMSGLGPTWIRCLINYWAELGSFSTGAHDRKDWSGNKTTSGQHIRT